MTQEQKSNIKRAFYNFVKAVVPLFASLVGAILATTLGADSTLSVLTGSTVGTAFNALS